MTIEEFQKMDLRVARIVSAENVEGSDKLVKLQVDIGEDSSTSTSAMSLVPNGSGQGERQIVAGIAKSYKPEQLVGKEIIIVVNLEPRKLLGLESNGMLLAAHDENGEPVLLIPEKEVQAGIKVT